MRILISASRNPYSLESEYHRALTGLGHLLTPHYGWDPGSDDELTLHRRIARRLSPRMYFYRSNACLLHEARETKPELIWLFKGADVFPETIDKLRELRSKVITFNPDHPWEFFSRGSGNPFISQSIDKFDHYLTYSRHIALQMGMRFPRLHTSVVPFGHGISNELYSRVDNPVESIRACFVGNPDKKRASKISLLAAHGISIDVYGHGWDNILCSSPRITICGPVTGLKMYEVFRKYRVQLNFLRPHNFNSHNMRTFEIPASGGIMLAEDTDEHSEFLRPGIEAFYFNSDHELIRQCETLLDMSTRDATAIRTAARRRSIEEPYSYRSRAEQVIKIVQEYL